MQFGKLGAGFGGIVSTGGAPSWDFSSVTLTGNKYILLGDSRTANSTENSNSADTPRVTAQGYGSYVQLGSNFRGQLVGNYGINTDTIDGCITRAHAAGISGGTAPGDPRRGWYMDYPPGSTADFPVVLVGVNNTVEPIATTGPKYDTLFKSLIDEYGLVIFGNELPNSNQSGQGATNYARRVYLDGWPGTSTGMTAGEKAFYGARAFRVNTYDTVADPVNPYLFAPGMLPVGESLHPAGAGNRPIGEAVSECVDALLSHFGYAPRNGRITASADSLSPSAMMTGSTAITATNGETAGAGGQNLDGQGGVGIQGSLPTGWTISRGNLATYLNAAQPVGSSQVSIVASKVIDAYGNDGLRIRITGQTDGGGPFSLNIRREAFYTAAQLTGGLNGGNSLADGDSIYAVANLAIAANPKGLLGIAPECQIYSAAYPDSGRTILSGSIATNAQRIDNWAAGNWTVLSQPRVIPAGFVATVETKTFRTQLSFHIAGGGLIDIDFTISGFGFVKNR
jgi:hypothetical protein